MYSNIVCITVLISIWKMAILSTTFFLVFMLCNICKHNISGFLVECSFLVEHLLHVTGQV